MASVNTAQAHWEGSLMEGAGSVELATSGAARFDLTWAKRAESGAGTTNPEELIAAAHAGCFTMALAAQLGEAGLKADRINTLAAVTLEKVDDGFTITEVHLDLVATVPGADLASFEMLANKAKTGCPVSKLLNAKIRLSMKLES